MNIGAGRVVWQDVVRIDKKIKDKELNKVENLTKSLQTAIDGNGRLHFLGLVSDGGVHSHILHLIALLKLAKEMGVPEVYIHFFGDGRDTDPNSGVGHMEHLLKATKEIGLGQIATVVGRYYAMDRDKRWDRVTVAMKAIVEGEGEDTEDVVKTMKERYEKGETDEFLKPIILGGKDSRVKGEFCLQMGERLGFTILRAGIQDRPSTASGDFFANLPEAIELGAGLKIWIPLYPDHIQSLISQQTRTPSSSSTTALTESAKSFNCSEASTAPQSKTSHTPKTSQSRQ